MGSPPLGLGGLVGTPNKSHYGASVNLVQTLLVGDEHVRGTVGHADVEGEVLLVRHRAEALVDGGADVLEPHVVPDRDGRAAAQGRAGRSDRS